MGEAFLRALLKRKVLTPRDILIVEPKKERRVFLKRSYASKVESEIPRTFLAFDTVILAVKPQESKEVALQVAKFLARKQLVISCMAGVTSKTLSRLLGGHKNLIRSMPNLAVRMGRGVSVYYCWPALSSALRRKAETIFRAGGYALKVSKERFLDAATAASGTGPAYIYYLVENFEKAARALGFSGLEAQVLAIETFSGALELLRESNLSAGMLRAKVTSRGGTTAAAVAVFEQKKMGEIFCEGVKAAYRRSRELGSDVTKKSKG